MTSDSNEAHTTIDSTFVERATAAVAGVSVSELTRFEQQIFDHLTQNEGRVVSKAELSSALYPNGDVPTCNTIEVFVGRLRRKIGETRISTVRGKGYQLNPPKLAAAS